MFHVKRLYIRTDLTVPEAGSLISIADLIELDGSSCRVARMIELDGSETIKGAYLEGRAVGQINTPQDTVPHPNTYGDFPDISYRTLSEEEYEALWTEATTKFPELG